MKHSDPLFEPVYTVDDYYDGPKSGVANYGGQPHFYRSLALDTEEWNPDDDLFELSPISSEVRDLAVEDFRLCQRWQRSAIAGSIPTLLDSTARVLPEDLPRHQAIIEILKPHLYINPLQRILVRGQFSQESEQTSNPALLARFLSGGAPYNDPVKGGRRDKL